MQLQLAPADGYDAGMFTLGVLLDLGQDEADRAALAGVQAYWAGVNARGGIAGLYPVELSVRHRDPAATSDGDTAALREVGAPGTSEGEAPPLGNGDANAGAAVGEWDVAALAYVGSSIDAAEVTAGLSLPVVPAVATLAGEDLDRVLTSAAPVELTTVALLDRFRASGPGATWCVIVDSSPLGRHVAAAAYAAGAARETVPAMLDLDVGEIEVLNLDASVFDVTDAVSDRQCRYVLVETSEPGAVHVLERLPPNLTVVRRSTLAAGIELPGQVELLIDPAPPWQTDRSAVMDAFAADWASFSADAAAEPLAQPASPTQPGDRPLADPRVRAGWLSQLRLHLLLEQAVAAGDVSRERLVALAGQVEPVDPDRNTLPGVPRIGMDISEPIGGGPLRTLRLYGRSDVAADDLGLRQVLALDVTHLMEMLRDRLGP